MNGSRTRWRPPAVLAMLIAVVLAAALFSACGDDDSDGGSEGSAGATADRNQGDAYPYTALAKYMYGDDWQEYVGEDGTEKTKADPNKEPITLGWINTDGGTSGRPYLTDLADMSVYMINEVLGGVEGHPVRLEKCIMQSNEAEGQQCAQQFANDPSIKAVIAGGVITGGTSFQRGMDGAKPIIAGVTTGPYDIGAPNTVAVSGSRYVSGTLMHYYAQEGMKNVGYVTGDDPLLVAAFNGVKDQVESLNIDVKMTPVYIDPAATDVTPTIIAANLEQYDAVYFVAPAAALCVPAIKALESQGITGSVPVAPNTACFDPIVSKAVGDFPEWDYFFYGPLIFAPFEPEDEVASYVQAARDTNSREAIDAEPASGPTVIGQVLHAAKLFNELGYDNLTEENISRELPKFEVPIFMGPPDLQYNTFEGLPNVGAIGFYIYHYNGNNEWEPLADGEWVSLPEGPGEG